jgi:hypothetical protein
MIIFGLSVFFFGSVGTGAFHCPRCGGDRHYKQKVGRRWFTLFFLPVIPLNEVGRVVECQTCKTRFENSVLRVATAGQIGSALPLIYRTFAVAVLRVGDSPTAREHAIGVAVSAGVRPYGPAELENDLRTLPPRLDDRAHEVVRPLDAGGRERIMMAATRVAVADAPVTDAERSTLIGIGEYLGLSMATIHGTISLMAEETRHP